MTPASCPERFLSLKPWLPLPWQIIGYGIAIQRFNGNSAGLRLERSMPLRSKFLKHHLGLDVKYDIVDLKPLLLAHPQNLTHQTRQSLEDDLDHLGYIASRHHAFVDSRSGTTPRDVLLQKHF